MSNKRIFGLDLLRSLAIIFVVLGHGIMLDKANTDFPWIKLINGVELFFVLSGFLIGRILIDTYLNQPDFNFIVVLHFWKRRWFRTLPTYYLVLILNIILTYYGIIGNDIKQFNWTFIFFLQNFFHPFSGFFWESWSLSIEEWFYLLFPIILWIYTTILVTYKVEKKFIFLMSILTMTFFSLIMRLVFTKNMEVDSFMLTNNIFKIVVYRFDGIGLGLLAAYVFHFYPKGWYASRNILFMVGIVLNYYILYAQWPPNDTISKVFKIGLQSAACAMLLPKFESLKKAPSLISKIATHISKISYSMYLINLAIVAQVINHNIMIASATMAWAMYFLFWVLVFVLSSLLYTYFEKPMTDLRDRW